MKLKDYEIPQYGPDDGLGQEDLSRYSLKNFDLKAYQLAQQLPQPDPGPVACIPSLLEQETASTTPLAAAREAPSPDQLCPTAWSSTPEPPTEPGFNHAATPGETGLNQLALDPREVQFGAHFNLHTVSYNSPSPAQSWKIPRWVVAMVGLFFGSAAVLTIAFCVVLLRDPNAAPAAPLAPPTAPVAATSAAPARPAPSSPAAVWHASPATASLMHDDSPPAHRIVVSRHPGVVRRQIHGARRVAGKGTSSAVEAQETETASTRPPQDALDKLLSESSL